MAKWEELPIVDRAQYMKIAVKNGYRDIRSIREAYNKFQEGGLENSETSKIPMIAAENIEASPVYKPYESTKLSGAESGLYQVT